MSVQSFDEKLIGRERLLISLLSVLGPSPSREIEETLSVVVLSSTPWPLGRSCYDSRKRKE